MTDATETKPKPKRSKAGRPEGATTKERDVVTALIIVDACPKCGSTKPPANKRLIRQGEASATVKGVVCQSYKHYAADCADCANVFFYREYRAAQS
jgi:predicted nucleic-acid-binding Zn-ribbon protein